MALGSDTFVFLLQETIVCLSVTRIPARKNDDGGSSGVSPGKCSRRRKWQRIKFGKFLLVFQIVGSQVLRLHNDTLRVNCVCSSQFDELTIGI